MSALLKKFNKLAARLQSKATTRRHTEDEANYRFWANLQKTYPADPPGDDLSFDQWRQSDEYFTRQQLLEQTKQSYNQKGATK